MTREWSVPCVYCGRKVWTITPVCNSRRCRERDARYKVKTASRVSSAGTPDDGGAGKASGNVLRSPEFSAGSVVAPATRASCQPAQRSLS